MNATSVDEAERAEMRVLCVLMQDTCGPVVEQSVCAMDTSGRRTPAQVITLLIATMLATVKIAMPINRG